MHVYAYPELFEDGMNARLSSNIGNNLQLNVVKNSLFQYIHNVPQGFFQKISQEGRNQGSVKFGGQSRIKQHGIKGGLGVLPQKMFGI